MSENNFIYTYHTVPPVWMNDNTEPLNHAFPCGGLKVKWNQKSFIKKQ